MTLLERDALLAQLQAHWTARRRAGPAGVRRGRSRHRQDGVAARASRSRCSAERCRCSGAPAMRCSTPRPLGPLDDIAGQARGELRALLDGGAERHRAVRRIRRPAADTARDWLCSRTCTGPTARRSTCCATWAGACRAPARCWWPAFATTNSCRAHPLRAVLGDLATSGALRLAPAPLSLDAVRTLCGERRRRRRRAAPPTAGNPFFVTEVLAAAERRLAGAPCPIACSDAVLARAARLSPSARAVLDAAAVAGPRTEPWLLQALTAAESTSIDECLATGVLRSRGTLFSFRHELARQAVLRAMTPSHATRLHRLALQALTSLDAERSDAARLAHHATAPATRKPCDAGRPLRRTRRRARGAHRQAAAHWAGAVEHAATNVERARWLDEYSAEAQMAGGLDEAVRARRDAARLWLGTGQPGSAAVSLSRLALLLVLAGRNAEAEASMREARSLIGPNDNAPAAFQVRLVAAGMRMLDHDSVEAIALIVPVLAEAERMNDEAAIVRSLVTLGAALLGLDRVDEGVAAPGAGARPGRASAQRPVDRHDLRQPRLGLRRDASARPRRALPAAGHRLLRRTRPRCPAPVPAVLARGGAPAPGSLGRRLRGRAGGHRRSARNADRPDHGAHRVGAAARAARRTGCLDRARRGTRAGCGNGDSATHGADARGARRGRVARRAQRRGCSGGKRGPATRKRQTTCPVRCGAGRFGAGAAALPSICPRFAHSTSTPSKPRADGATPRKHGRERAVLSRAARALADGDERAQREALAVFESLGARPMVERVRRKLRAAGVRRVPRGPRSSTRAASGGAHEQGDGRAGLARLGTAQQGNRPAHEPLAAHHRPSPASDLRQAGRGDTRRGGERSPSHSRDVSGFESGVHSSGRPRRLSYMSDADRRRC